MIIHRVMYCDMFGCIPFSLFSSVLSNGCFLVDDLNAYIACEGNSRYVRFEYVIREFVARTNCHCKGTFISPVVALHEWSKVRRFGRFQKRDLPCIASLYPGPLHADR